jgi:ankyrin repeat protein
MSSRIITALLNQEWDKAKDLIHSASLLEIMATLDNGLSALHIAIKFNQLAIARALLIRGAKINGVAQDMICQNMTPLHFAALLGHHHCAQLLHAWGADISIKNSQGKTAHDLALLAGHHQLAQSLKPTVLDARLSNILELAKVQRSNNPFIREMISDKLTELENSTPESKQATQSMNQKSIALKNQCTQPAKVISFPLIPTRFTSK